jgi:hypothetical protein
MDHRLISEKQRGLSAKSAKLDCGLISKKHMGFFAKWRGISAGIYFSTDKAVDWPGALGPPWTDDGADRGGPGAAACSPELSLWPLRCAKALRRGRGAVKLGGGAHLLLGAEGALGRGGRGV